MHAELYSWAWAGDLVHQVDTTTSHVLDARRPRMRETRNVSTPTQTASVDITGTLRRDEAPVAKGEVVFGIQELSVHYGSHLALASVDLDIYKNLVTAMIGPSGCGKSTFIRCLNRMNDLIPGVKVGGQVLYHGHGHLRPRRRPGRGAPAHRHGLSEAEPVSEVNLRQRRLCAEEARPRREHGRARRASTVRCRPLGRGQGPAETECARPLRRTAAAPLHCPRACGRARRDPPRRTGVGARSDLDRRDRGPDARAQARLHAGDRHAQHATGCPGRRHDRLLQPRS